MNDLFTGVRVHEVKKEIIDELYKEKKVETFDARYNWFENLYLVLKDECGSQSSALAKVKNNEIVLLNNDKKTVQGIKPRNKEQAMALDALMDDSINVVVLTGLAGSGKTLMSLVAALEKLEKGVYKKLLLTKPMSQVTKYDLGILPGDVDEKFNPYLQNYMCNLDFIFGETRGSRILELYNIEFLPLQLIRGASWHNSIILVDEAQVLNYHEMVTIGTRVAEGSKLVILGDLSQRDEKIAKEKTGIYKFVNSDLVKNCNFVSSIHLLKSERSKVAKLFADVFEAK